MNTDFGSNVLGRTANVVSIIDALGTRGGLEKLLTDRVSTLQNPDVRSALQGNQFLSRALGLGGTMVPGRSPAETFEAGLTPEQQRRLGVEVLGPTASAGGAGGSASVPGGRYFSPNLPPLGIDAQSDLLGNIARIQALQQIFSGGGVTRPQAETLLGVRGAAPAGYPGGSQVTRMGGRDFLQSPDGMIYPLTGKSTPSWSVEDIGGIMQNLFGGGGAPGGGATGGISRPGATGEPRYRKGIQIPLGGGEPRISITQLPPSEVSESRRAGAGMDLRVLVEGLTRKWHQLNPDIPWDPVTMRDFENLARQQGLIDPTTGQPVRAIDVTTNGQFDSEKYQALYDNAVDQMMADELDAALGE